jgi:outer membrane PBP1 activator LpoA protein
MGNGMTLNAVFLDMRSESAKASVTRTKTDTAIPRMTLQMVGRKFSDIPIRIAHFESPTSEEVIKG